MSRYVLIKLPGNNLKAHDRNSDDTSDDMYRNTDPTK